MAEMIDQQKQEKLETSALWQSLARAGLTQGTEPCTESAEDSPWYIKVLLGFSGWLASWFGLAFFALFFEAIIDKSWAVFGVGGILLVAAFFLLRRPQNEFIDNIALALSLAGQALIIWGFFEHLDWQGEGLYLSIALFQSVLAILMPSYLHRFFSAFGAAYAAYLATSQLGFNALYNAGLLALLSWLWLHEFNWPKYLRAQQAICYGLSLCVLFLGATGAVGYSLLSELSYRTSVEFMLPFWLGSVLLAILMLWLVWLLVQRHRVKGQGLSKGSVFALVAGVLLACVSLAVPNLAIALVLILIGFAQSNRVLLGLGILSLLFYVSSYYYFLETTLLMKSVLFFALGVILLAGRWFMLKSVRLDALNSKQEGVEHV